MAVRKNIMGVEISKGKDLRDFVIITPSGRKRVHLEFCFHRANFDKLRKMFDVVGRGLYNRGRLGVPRPHRG